MKQYLPHLLAVVLLVAFRVVGIVFPEALPNFQPLMAVFFCGALITRAWSGLALPLVAWLITYPFGKGSIPDAWLFATTATATAYLVTYMMGRRLLQSDCSSGRFILGSFAASLTFHLITCCFAWFTEPVYVKTLTGLWQSIWLGPPSSEIPSWVFLRNLCAANLLFTAIIRFCTTPEPLNVSTKAPSTQATSLSI